MRTATLIACLMFGSAAYAGDDPIPLSVQVLDAEGNAISEAGVRHKEEKELHPVNTETGVWTGSVLYLPDGNEIVFTNKMEVSLEVSAPGYEATNLVYTMAKRKNTVVVTLKELVLDMEDEEMPDIGFRHDTPRN